ncbi:UNVERIFIED_CONTAM: Ribonuclease HI [Sesamum latifolium]|uniref:Ribonuclease HI n=1 Tax=Sesamum latifolium TaxID=2727402 RepID=A0AAW2Y6E3_9LAMI
MEFVVKFEFKASNSEAEYEAVVLGMRMAQDAGTSHLLVYSDSQLIVKQVNGEYEAKEESMVQFLQQIEELKIKFKSFQLHQIPREENIKADSLSKLASALEDYKTRRITVQHLPQSQIPLDIQLISSSNNDWRTPIIHWINEDHLPGDRWETTKIKNRAIYFLMQGGVIQEVLYTSSTQVPISRRGLTRTQRNTRWMLRIPHRDLGISQQSTKSWLLLAHYEARCTLLGEQVREMPKTHHPHTPTC